MKPSRLKIKLQPTYAHEYLSSDRCGVTELSLGSAVFYPARGHKRCSVRALLVHGCVRVLGGCIVILQTKQCNFVAATFPISERL